MGRNSTEIVSNALHVACLCREERRTSSKRAVKNQKNVFYFSLCLSPSPLPTDFFFFFAWFSKKKKKRERRKKKTKKRSRGGVGEAKEEEEEKKKRTNFFFFCGGGREGKGEEEEVTTKGKRLRTSPRRGTRKSVF